ncbi:MAG: endopeptidase La [Candidatus Shikimatogenerans bostrichidophilus]|nr:MAG: endopeptidase La [Candidatus Shikimatogenerans bostrichidophilus]
MNYINKNKKSNSNFKNFNTSNIIHLIKINKKKKKKYKIINLLPINNIVLFPKLIIPITIFNKYINKIIKKNYKKNKLIGVITKKDFNKDDYNIKNYYKIGTLAKIIKILYISDNSLTIIIQGVKRFKIKKIYLKKKKIKSYIKILKDINIIDKNFYILIDLIKDLSLKIIKKNYLIHYDNFNIKTKTINNINFLINFISFNLNIKFKYKQIILEENKIKNKALLIIKYLNIEYQKIKIKKKIQDKIKLEINKQQKEYYLNQQLKVIKEELGYMSNDEDLNYLKKKSENKKWSKEAYKQFKKEFYRIKRMNIQMPEYNIIKNYLYFMVNLPWFKYSKDNFDINNAIRILNKNHFGLNKIKERIIEYLSVLKLKGNMKAPILCFFGPPGVGKTSLGKSIAEVLCRKYIRMSLGGIHDESEIRGHRKTYVGAMPGRILQFIKKVGTSNPVFVLDEIDKISIRNINGDPSSAMLEVLDPEQNKYFYDNYLELGYDLSKILFIATANNLHNINPALLDRMEVININGYTVEEKIEIANKFIFPKQLKENGLQIKQLKITKKKFEKIIENYTYESGIRNLERCISKIIRNIAKNIVMKKRYKININFKKIKKILGIYTGINKYEKINKPGINIGLSWTNFGGDILYVESNLIKGKGDLTITGNIGKIMKESCIIAIKYIKSNYKDLNINYYLFLKYNVHLHVPEGAIPKDGPSAGITILITLLSLYKKKIVKPYFAMTGEITLRGKILEVGGIKEKILAAKRAYIKNIILPKNNKKDIYDINKKYLYGIKFFFVNTIKDVIKLIF